MFNKFFRQQKIGKDLIEIAKYKLQTLHLDINNRLNMSTFKCNFLVCIRKIASLNNIILSNHEEHLIADSHLYKIEERELWLTSLSAGDLVLVCELCNKLQQNLSANIREYEKELYKNCSYHENQ